MNRTTLRRLAGLLLLGISLVALAWGAWPALTSTQRLAFHAADLGLASGPDWQASLSWPPRLRIGDTAFARLELVEAGPAAGATQSPVSETGSVLVTARLELAGMGFSPQGEVSQVVLPGKPLIFAWRLQAGHAGQFPATLWLHRIDRPAGAAAPRRSVLSAQRLELRASSLLGLDGPWARSLGAAGVVIGAAFGLDGLAVWFWRRIQARSARVG